VSEQQAALIDSICRHSGVTDGSCGAPYSMRCQYVASCAACCARRAALIWYLQPAATRRPNAADSHRQRQREHDMSRYLIRYFLASKARMIYYMYAVRRSARKVITFGYEDIGYNLVMKGLCYGASGGCT
jgi:hypothetical protein